MSAIEATTPKTAEDVAAAHLVNSLAVLLGFMWSRPTWRARIMPPLQFTTGEAQP